MFRPSKKICCKN
jgi:hypothetical protein